MTRKKGRKGKKKTKKQRQKQIQKQRQRQLKNNNLYNRNNENYQARLEKNLEQKMFMERHPLAQRDRNAYERRLPQYHFNHAYRRQLNNYENRQPSLQNLNNYVTAREWEQAEMENNNVLNNNIVEYDEIEHKFNSKRIFVIMGHANLGSLDNLTEKLKNNPLQYREDYYKRCDKENSVTSKVNLLSLTNMGKKGISQISYVLFYIMKFYPNFKINEYLSDIETQSEANKFNYFFQYILQLYRSKLFEFLKGNRNFNYIKNDETFFSCRIYNNKIKKQPVNISMNFYPFNRKSEKNGIMKPELLPINAISMDHYRLEYGKHLDVDDEDLIKYIDNFEINGLFDFTIKEHNSIIIDNYVLSNIFDIKPCFLNQIRYYEQNGNDILEIVRASLLIPDASTVTSLKQYDIDMDFFAQDVFYNSLIYLNLKSLYIPGQHVKILLSEIINLVKRHTCLIEEDILILENGCKSFEEIYFKGSDILTRPHYMYKGVQYFDKKLESYKKFPIKESIRAMREGTSNSQFSYNNNNINENLIYTKNIFYTIKESGFKSSVDIYIELEKLKKIIVQKEYDASLHNANGNLNANNNNYRIYEDINYLEYIYDIFYQIEEINMQKKIYELKKNISDLLGIMGVSTLQVAKDQYGIWKAEILEHIINGSLKNQTLEDLNLGYENILNNLHILIENKKKLDILIDIKNYLD